MIEDLNLQLNGLNSFTLVIKLPILEYDWWLSISTHRFLNQWFHIWVVYSLITIILGINNKSAIWRWYLSLIKNELKTKRSFLMVFHFTATTRNKRATLSYYDGLYFY